MARLPHYAQREGVWDMAELSSLSTALWSAYQSQHSI